jgi:uncharacterized protein (TIGR02996 family)
MRELLEKAISENPEDAAPHAAYADWLTEQGDPRGEFIRVQLALEDEALDSARRSALRAEEDRLLKAHLQEWLGPELSKVVFRRRWFRTEQTAQVGFRRGWLDRLEFQDLDRTVADALVRSSATKLLRTLAFDGGAWADEWQELAQARCAGGLRDFRFGNDPLRSNGLAEGATEFFLRTPNLETLEIMASQLDTRSLFACAFPRLRALAVHHEVVYAVDVLARNTSLANLERIAFQPSAVIPEDTGAYLNLSHLEALTRSPVLKAVRQLEFHASDAGDEGCRELVQSGFLKQLRHLNLAYGRISDDGARDLVASGLLPQLEVLNLTGNALSNTGRALLESTGVNLIADDQHAPDDNDYLYRGDWE